MSSTPGTVVDTSVLLDVFAADARWVRWSRDRLVEAAGRGSLIVNAVVVAELAPQFSAIGDLVGALPPIVRVEDVPTAAAFLAGHVHARYRREGGSREAILPDFLIGAHAAVTSRPLLTRDPRRVAAYIPGADLVSPGDE